MIGLDLVTKWPFPAAAATVNNGELTIVRNPPSPPQNEPVDFSTKKPKLPKSRESLEPPVAISEVSVLEDRNSFTSSRELRFSKNLKRLITEIVRRKPVEGRIIVEYLKSTWNRLHSDSVKGIRSCAAANGQQSQSGGSFSGRGGSSSNSSNYNGGGNGNNSSGGGCGGSSGGSGNGNGQDGGSGSGAGGDRYGGGGGGGGHGHNGGNGNGREGDGGKDSGRPRGSILDMDLDFEDLPTSASSTAKWFSDHPDINAAKVIDGLLNLKSEFPPGQDGCGGLSKPPDLAALDHATANLLQMSVPDPSTTFLDIGTDLGGASLYEDDPFSLEHLLPSNFNINQLDLAQSPSERLPPETSVTLDKRSFMSGGSTAVVLPTAPMPHHNQYAEPGAVGAPVNYTVNAHLTHLEPLSASTLAGRYIKTEPVIKTEIDLSSPHNCINLPLRSSNNHLGMFGHDHHDLSGFEPMHLSSRLSPVSSSLGSMPSPGSPPTSHAFYEKLPTGLAITALAANSARPSLTPSNMMGQSGADSPPPPHVGGGKMKSSSSGPSRKKSSVSETGQEDDELLNVPSLQVRISILQQRVSKHHFNLNVSNYLELETKSALCLNELLFFNLHLILLKNSTRWLIS